MTRLRLRNVDSVVRQKAEHQAAKLQAVQNVNLWQVVGTERGGWDRHRSYLCVYIRRFVLDTPFLFSIWGMIMDNFSSIVPSTT